VSPRIFISYRREDASAQAARLRDRLASADAFGETNVFMDVDRLRAGQDFEAELNHALGKTDIFLAVIGPRWVATLAAKGAKGERDYVVEEIATALVRGIPVIPVLVDRAPLPSSAELPKSLRNLLRFQKLDLVHESFGRDVAALVQDMKALWKAKTKPEPTRKPRWAIAAASMLLAIIGGAYLALTWPDEEGPAGKEGAPAQEGNLPLPSAGKSNSKPAPVSPPSANAKPQTKKAWLGVGFKTVNRGIADVLGLREATGVMIYRIVAGSPAANSELRVRDVIVEFNGSPIAGREDIRRMFATLQPNADARLRVYRGGSVRSISVTLGEAPDSAETGQVIDELEALGLSYVAASVLYDDRSMYGVVITQVAPDSAATSQGLRAGDLILGVSDTPIRDGRDLTAAIAQARSAGKKSIALRVRSRGGQVRALTFTYEQ
jgi:hypothetical protein